MKKVLLALGVLMLARPAMADVTLNVTSWAAPGHPMPVTLGPLCDDIKKVTEGRVVCNILPKAVSDPAQTFDAVRDGIADLGYIVQAYNPGRFPMTEIAEFPMGGTTAEVNSVAFWRVYTSMLNADKENDGVVLLGVATHGPGMILNNKHPVKKISDMEGLKLRVGGGMASKVASAVGAVPIAKPATEVYELLSGGVIDGILFARDGIIPYKLDELVKYVTFVPGGFYTVAFGWIANPDKWNSIPESDRKLIEPLIGEALARRTGRAFDEADKLGWAAIQKAGIDVTIADDQFLADLKEKLVDIRADWIKTAESKGVDGAAALEAYQAEVKKIEASN